MKINYIYKKESSDSFISNGSNIELKQYEDNLIFYSPLNDKYRAEYALYDKCATYETSPEVFTGGPFGSYLKIKDSYSFDIKNFETINSQGRISFYLGSNKLVESAKVALVKNKNFPENGLKPGSYSLTITVDGKPTSTMIIKCTNKEGTSIKQLKNLILFQLDPMIYPYELNTLNTQNDRILLQSLFEGKTLKISDGLDGKNLLDYFDAEPIEYGSSPNVNIDILKFHNLTISHIKNKETGEDKSYLRFSLSGVGLLEGENSSNDSSNDSSNNGSSDDFEKEYEKAITKQIVEIPWNSDSIHLDNVEIDFDDRMMYIFINGKLKSIQFLENKFKKTEQTLELLGKKENPYSFDEIIINNKCIHTKDFELDKKQLTKYTTKKPYIDFYFSGNDLKKGMELKALSQSGIECCLCDGGNFYYYSSGAWRRARGSFEDTNDWYLFTDKIKNYDYY